MIQVESIQIPFRYAAGEVASRFLVALRDEQRILGSRCQSCERIASPARSICPWCADATDELVAVGPSGTLISATQTPKGAFGLVKLDGSDSAILHRLASAELALGTRMVAVFAEQRRGAIEDISRFDPVSLPHTGATP